MALRDLLYSGQPDTDVKGDSVNVAEGFIPVQKSIDALTQAISQQTSAMKALSGMQRNFGTEGSSSYATNVDGTNALYGVTTEATLRDNAQRMGLRKARADGTLWSDYDASQRPPVSTTPAQPSSNTFGGRARQFGGQLAQAGFAAMNPTAWNPRAGQTSSTGGGGTVPPASGSGGGGGGGRTPALSGGSGGGTGGSSGLYGGFMSSMQKVPGVGTALGIVDEIQSQRQKNAYYQSIEGGDNTHGFGERWNEALGSFTTMGMFAPGEYSALYKDATKLGYTDRFDNSYQSRKGAIDFGYQNKSSMGMDASESSKYLETASRSATMSFQQLSTALEGVSSAAGKAGVNTQMARAQFDALLNSNLANGLTGSSAVSTTQATSEFKASMGRQFQQTDFGKATSVGMNYMVASTNGLTGNQFLAVANANPAAAAAMREKTQNQGLDGVINSQVKSWIRNQVQQVGGPEAIAADKSLADTFWPQFLATFPALDWYSVKSILQTFSGAAFGSDTDAFEYLVQWVMGKDANQTLMQKSKDAQVKSVAGQSSVNKDDLGTDWRGSLSDAGNAYMNWSSKNHKVDPVMESMLKGMNKGGVSQNDQMVQVITSNGPRVVTLAEAVEKFPDQVSSGQAKFKGGALEGKNASAYGTLDQSASRVAAAKAEAANKNNSNVGQSLQDYNKNNPTANGNGSSSNVGVTIGLSPQAAQFFTATQTANGAGVAPGTWNPQSADSRSLTPAGQ